MSTLNSNVRQLPMPGGFMTRSVIEGRLWDAQTRWFVAQRPVGMTEDEHLANPTAGLTDPVDRELAKAIAQVVNLNILMGGDL